MLPGPRWLPGACERVSGGSGRGAALGRRAVSGDAAQPSRARGVWCTVAVADTPTLPGRCVQAPHVDGDAGKGRGKGTGCLALGRGTGAQGWAAVSAPAPRSPRTLAPRASAYGCEARGQAPALAICR
jgi:hypothetical protein